MMKRLFIFLICLIIPLISHSAEEIPSSEMEFNYLINFIHNRYNPIKTTFDQYIFKTKKELINDQDKIQIYIKKILIYDVELPRSYKERYFDYSFLFAKTIAALEIANQNIKIALDFINKS